MNKLFSKIAALSVGLAMAVGVGVAVNSGSSRVEEVKAAAPYDFEDDTVVFANQGLENGVQYLDPFTNGSFSVQFEGGANDGKYYTTGSGMRVYGGGSFTVTGISGNVTSLTFSWDGSYKPSSTTVVNTGTLSSDYLTWTGDAETVTLTRPSGSGHWRLKSVQAVLKSGGEAKITLSKTAVTFLSTDEGLDVSVNAVNFGGTPTLSLSATPAYVNIAFNGLGFSISPKAVGTETVTIVATYETTVASAELSVVVNDPHGRIPDDPFTVSEVIAALDAGLSSSDYVYVTGIISEVTKLQDGQMTYWIGANSSSKSFEVFKGKNVGNVNFTALSDLEVGGTVVVYGTTTIYQSTTYEFNPGNYLISYVAPVVERTLVSIEVSGQKTEYNVGDEFVKPVVTAHYDDEYSKPVTDSAVFSGYDLSVAGEQTVEVSYTEDEVTKETSYTITVTAPVTANYRRLTVSLQDYTGDYLIVCEDENLDSPVSFDGSLDTLDATNNNVAVSIDDDLIELVDTHEFHVAKKGDGFSIQSDSGKYIGRTANSNGLDANASDNYTNSISYENGVMNVKGSGGAYMRFNSASNQNRFRFFASTSYTGQKAISLFMKVSPAESFALDILNGTNDSCAAYVDGETEYDKSTFSSLWSSLALKFNALDPEDQADLIDANADMNGVMLEEAMARYDFLCAKYKLDNFMTGRTLSYSISAPQFSIESNNSYIVVIIVISSAAVLSLSVLLILKKRKHN